jgi:microcystin-dependent protein
MTDQFVGEIRAVGFNFAPQGWARCEGQLLPISQNTALFSLLGTSYGGDGRSNFALPDLRGASPMHAGQGQGLSAVFLGEEGGTETVTLAQPQIPLHTHTVSALAGNGSQNSPANAVYAQAHVGRLAELQYAPTGSPVTMAPNMLGVMGQGLPHNNMPPYLTVNFIIALQGVFPPRG